MRLQVSVLLYIASEYHGPHRTSLQYFVYNVSFIRAKSKKSGPVYLC